MNKIILFLNGSTVILLNQSEFKINIENDHLLRQKFIRVLTRVRLILLLSERLHSKSQS